MTRIFLTLAVLSNLAIVVAFLLGLNIGDAASADAAVQAAVRFHFQAAIGALVFAALVHAIVLTYFMGTGRWIEETASAYSLSNEWRRENQSLKYRTIPALVGAFFLLVVNGSLGAAVDPGSAVDFREVAGIAGARIHMLVAALALGVNVIVNVLEYGAIQRNGRLIDEVLAEVRRIREERGLPV